MKSSYQHTVVRFTLLLFALGFSVAQAQPPGRTNKYIGLGFPQPKNKNPKELLRWLNNKGYPYAQLELDTLLIAPGSTEFVWNISLGKSIVLDTLITSGGLFNKRTLQRCINYKPGEAFSPDKIENIRADLNQVTFLKPNAQVSIRLHSETFSIALKTERKKNNAIAALIALQPRPNSNQSILTGNIDLELSNALKQAEIIELHWKRPQPKSQSLAFKLGSPFTAGLPIGFQFEFQSFLLDSTFSSTDLSLRVLTKMSDLNGFSAAVNRSTNTHFQNSSIYGNTQIKSYSIRYSKYSSTDGSLNFLIEGQAGNRSVQSESNNSEKKMYAIRSKVYSEFNLNKLLFTRMNLEANGLFSDSLFNNEISRLGGTKNLRAFIEESIYASQFAMFNGDFGVALGQDIQSYLFADIAYVRTPITKTYYDAGIGFRFQQENGAVSITYGVGNIENNGLQIKNGRVGITLSSRF